MVSLEDWAWTANIEADDVIDVSTTVKTFEKLSFVNASGDTSIGFGQQMISYPIQGADIREFLSRAKNSFSKSSDASLSSFKFSFLPNAPELVSVSSRAITTTGTGVAVFAVFGLNTSVLISSKDFGASEVALRASRQVAGEVVSLCATLPDGVIERLAKD